MLKCQGCGKEFLYAANKLDVHEVAGKYSTLEAHVCPFCNSLDLGEVEETQPRIESIVSVKICDADALIKQGYEVKDTYASTVTLIKKVEQKGDALVQSLQEFMRDKHIASCVRNGNQVTLILEDKEAKETA